MPGHQRNDRRQHCGVVGEAEAGDDVGYGVHGHDEIGQRGEQHGAHPERSAAIHGAIIGGEEVSGERDAPRDAFELVPEFAADFLLPHGEGKFIVSRIIVSAAQIARFVSASAHGRSHAKKHTLQSGALTDIWGIPFPRQARPGVRLTRALGVDNDRLVGVLPKQPVEINRVEHERLEPAIAG